MFTGETADNIPLIITELIEYVPNQGKTRTIIKHTVASRIVLSFAAVPGMAKVNVHADMYIQVITGHPELTINLITHLLNPGDGKIIPLNSSYSFNSSLQFKMLMSIVHTVSEKYYEKTQHI